MKFIFALLVLTPLVYCATLTHEEQLVIQAMTSEQKRAFLNLHLPSLHDVTNEICKVLASDAGHSTCEAACPVALAAIPYGSFASALCGPACSAIHC